MARVNLKVQHSFGDHISQAWKTFLIATPVAVLFLFVLFSNTFFQQTQNTKQEAATDATTTCKNNGGTCMATSGCSSTTKWNSGYCNTYNSPGLYCCIPKTVTTPSSCTALGGKCADTNQYGCTQTWQTGKCTGTPLNIKCCFGTLCKCADTSTNKCSVPWKIGLCPGGANMKCCAGTVSPIKVPCNSTIGGTCRTETSTYYCSVSISTGICPSGQICCHNGSFLPRQ